jgi:hypothetical protein
MMFGYKQGEIVETDTGPHFVVQNSCYGNIGFASLNPVEGPPTKTQQEYRDYHAEQKRRAEAKAAALRERIRNRIEPDLSEEKLIDLIVDLIHEESEY